MLCSALLCVMLCYALLCHAAAPSPERRGALGEVGQLQLAVELPLRRLHQVRLSLVKTRGGDGEGRGGG
jgi:hypothetical protein